MLRRLSQDESLGLLREGKVGRLGCVDGDKPYVVPISYVMKGNSLYVHSLPGMKIDLLRNNPNACIQVDEVTDAFHWKSVLARGRYTEVTDAQEREGILAELEARFPNLTPVESVPVHDGQSSVIVFRIDMDQLSGVGEF